MKNLSRAIVRKIIPYEPGKPIEEVVREFGVENPIKLASNENPLGPPFSAVETIKANAGNVHYYPESSAYYLRQKLSEKLNISPEQILTGNGTAEITEIISEAFLDPEQAAITGKQAFFKYRIAIQIMGAKIIDIPMPDLDYDVDAIIKAMESPEVKLIFIANPNNPTGLYLEKKSVDALVENLREDQILIIDEAYHEYVQKTDYPDSISYVNENKNVIVLRTFSKIYALAGLRIGYAIARPDIIKAMYQVKEAFNTNILAQKAAFAALDEEDFVEKSRELNRKGKLEFYRNCKKFGVKYYPSETNFILIDLEKDAIPVFSKMLEKGVIVRPLKGYELPTCLRVSIGLPEQMERFWEVFKEVAL